MTAPIEQAMYETAIRERDELQTRVDELEAKHEIYLHGHIAKFTEMMVHLRVYDRVRAWKKAFDTSDAASDIVYDAFSDMPCDLYDVCPELEALDDEADEAAEYAREIEAKADEIKA